MGMMDQGSRRRQGAQTSAEPARPREVPMASDEMLSLLSAEEMAAIRAEATGLAAEKKRAAARDAFRNQCVEEELRKLEPQHQTRELLIDLAPFAKDIRLDNRVYVHGGVYLVPMPVYYMLQEIISRSWAHDRAVGSPNRDLYRPISQVAGQNFIVEQNGQRSARISPANVDQVLAHQHGRMHS
jgi:hypothetical protein